MTRSLSAEIAALQGRSTQGGSVGGGVVKEEITMLVCWGFSALQGSNVDAKATHTKLQSRPRESCVWV